jgi:MtfA peptidase
MIFSWLKNKRRAELVAKPLPGHWRESLRENVRHYRYLRSTGALEQMVQVIVAEKEWASGPKFEVTEEMKVTVAGQAAVLALGLEEPYYFDGVETIILHPRTFLYRDRPRAGDWFFREDIPLSGQAWHRGPIILSWQDVLECGRNASGGHNVVVHEFAHFLDDLDGEVDGDPPLAGRERQKNWHRVTETEYRRLLGQARRNEATLLDHYGASSRAEFFAVASECFFEQPRALRRRNDELYGVLKDFYRQDPAQWLPDAAIWPDDGMAKTSAKRRRFARRSRDERLARLRSQNADILYTMAVEYFEAGRYRLAAAVASKAIERKPDDVEAYQLRASARLKLRRYVAALVDCEKALQYDPDDGTAYRVRGAACLGLGEYDEAKQDLDLALKENRNDAEALYLRGRAWMALGDPSRAVSDFEESLTIRPLVAEVYYHSGLANRALGDLEEAEADLAKAFDLDPLVDRRP